MLLAFIVSMASKYWIHVSWACLSIFFNPVLFFYIFKKLSNIFLTWTQDSTDFWLDLQYSVF